MEKGLREECPGYSPKDCIPENIRAIYVAGEASEAGVKELGRAARKAVGVNTAKVLEDIKASEVVAYGAARLAKWMIQDLVEHPGVFENLVLDDYSHDEL